MAHRSLPTVGQRIRDEVAALTAGQQRRYPARLQRRIAVYAQERLREGVARARVCAELGVSDPTLSRFLGSEARSPRLRPVRLVAEAEATPETRRVVVRAPGGIVIEGLDVLGLVALVRALS